MATAPRLSVAVLTPSRPLSRAIRRWCPCVECAAVKVSVERGPLGHKEPVQRDVPLFRGGFIATGSGGQVAVLPALVTKRLPPLTMTALFVEAAPPPITRLVATVIVPPKSTRTWLREPLLPTLIPAPVMLRRPAVGDDDLIARTVVPEVDVLTSQSELVPVTTCQVVAACATASRPNTASPRASCRHRRR